MIKLKAGDYVSVGDMKKYAEANGITLGDVYRLVYDKFIQAGCPEGEGLDYVDRFTDDHEVYGWSYNRIRDEGLLFYYEGEYDFEEYYNNQISVVELLPEIPVVENNLDAFLNTLPKIRNQICSTTGINLNNEQLLAIICIYEMNKGNDYD